MSTKERRINSRPRDRWTDLEDELIGDGGPLAQSERLVFDNLIRAQSQLEQLEARIQADGLTAEGSKGQIRPHPLLVEQRALRSEVSQGIADLRRRRASALQIAEANELTRWSPE